MRFSPAIAVLACLHGGSLGLAAAQQAVVLPSGAQVRLTGQTYAILVVSEGPFALVGDRIMPVAARTLCPVGGREGQIEISGRLIPRQQAKALIHETTHVAVNCDIRKLDDSEKIAEAVADLFESAVGDFVVKGLKR